MLLNGFGETARSWQPAALGGLMRPQRRLSVANLMALGWLAAASRRARPCLTGRGNLTSGDRRVVENQMRQGHLGPVVTFTLLPELLAMVTSNLPRCAPLKRRSLLGAGVLAC